VRARARPGPIRKAEKATLISERGRVPQVTEGAYGEAEFRKLGLHSLLLFRESPDVLDLDVAPPPAQVLGYQSPMAMLRFVFAAEQAAAI